MRLVEYFNDNKDHDPKLYLEFFDTVLYSHLDFESTHVDKLNDILDEINPDIEDYDVKVIHAEFLKLRDKYPDTDYDYDWDD